MYRVVLCWLYCLKIIFVESLDLLVEEPSSLLLPVDTDGTFTCTSVENSTIEWRIDARDQTALVFFGQSLMSLTDLGFTKIQTNQTNSSTVSVKGFLLNNDTRLRCLAFLPLDDGQQIDTSSDAVLQFYAPPDPPSNIQLNVHSPLSLLLSWSPPFFPFASIPYTYNLFKIKSNGDRETIANISSNVTNYIYNGSSADVCQNISFSLQSVNDAGAGAMSNMTTGIIPEVPDRISEVTTDVELNNSNALKLLVNIKSPSVCQDYPVLSYSVTLTDITGGDDDNITTTTSTIEKAEIANSDGDMIELIIEDGIEQNRIYTVTVATINEVGLSVNSNEVEFRTTDIQQILVSYLPGSTITVTCTFIRGSLAKGCHIVVKTTPTNIELISQKILRNGTEEVIQQVFDGRILVGMDISRLLVLGYGYESDGTMEDVPIMADINTVPITTTTTTTTASASTQTVSSVSVVMTTSVQSTARPKPVPSGTTIAVGAVCGLIIIVTASVIIIVVLICVIRRNHLVKQPNADAAVEYETPHFFRSSSIELQNNTAYSQHPNHTTTVNNTVEVEVNTAYGQSNLNSTTSNSVDIVSHDNHNHFYETVVGI